MGISTLESSLLMLFVGNCMALPPVEFIAQFASKHGRTSVAFYLPPMSHSSTIAKHWSLMMKNSFPMACVFRHFDDPLESFEFGDTDLHVFIPDLQNWNHSLDQFIDIYNNRTLTSREYWLVHLDSNTNIEDFEIALALQKIQLDLDDDLFLTYYANDQSLQIKELYKIRPSEDFEVISLPYANFTTGLMLSPNEKWNRRKDLQGVVMKIAGLESMPYITSMTPVRGQPGFFKMEGLCAEVVFALQEIMNFTFTLIQPPDMQWGALQADGSWSGMVNLLHTQQIDFATDFQVTHARSEVITFAQPIRETYHSLFIQNPSNTLNYKAYIEPLHYLAWMLVGLFCLVTPIFIYLIAKYML